MADFYTFKLDKEKGKPGFDEAANLLRRQVDGLWVSTDKCKHGYHEILLLGDRSSHGLLRGLLELFHLSYKWGVVPQAFYGPNKKANLDAVRNYLIESGGYGTDPQVEISVDVERAIIIAADFAWADFNWAPGLDR